jgi:hypothetical protein
MSTRKQDQKNQKTKSPYRAPTLKEYGSVTDITQGGMGDTSDGASGSYFPD